MKHEDELVMAWTATTPLMAYVDTASDSVKLGLPPCLTECGEDAATEVVCWAPSLTYEEAVDEQGWLVDEGDADDPSIHYHPTEWVSLCSTHPASVDDDELFQRIFRHIAKKLAPYRYLTHTESFVIFTKADDGDPPTTADEPL